MLYIFDIDGTLADNGHRLHYIGDAESKEKPMVIQKDWDTYRAKAIDDTVIIPVADMFRDIQWCCDRNDSNTAIITGRSIVESDTTHHWLKENDLMPSAGVWMRDDGDCRRDATVKLEILTRLLSAHGMDKSRVVIFEDRTRVVIAYRNAGMTVCQVREGDF
jgi:FMN phosphatase YigB (HAD superfamily)